MKRKLQSFILVLLFLGCASEGQKFTLNDFSSLLGAIGTSLEEGAAKRQDQQLKQAIINNLSRQPAYYSVSVPISIPPYRPSNVVFYDSNRSVIGYGNIEGNQLSIYDTNRNYMGYATIK